MENFVKYEETHFSDRAFSCFFSAMRGNKLSIGNVTIPGITASATILSFQISWENSWRVASTNPPGNYDAVRIFVKRACCSEPLTCFHCDEP